MKIYMQFVVFVKTNQVVLKLKFSGIIGNKVINLHKHRLIKIKMNVSFNNIIV